MYNIEELKTKEVEYGWGVEMEAIEFTKEMAEDGLCLLQEFQEKNPDSKNPNHDVLHDYCINTLDSEPGETMYILKEFWTAQIQTLDNLFETLYAKNNVGFTKCGFLLKK